MTFGEIDWLASGLRFTVYIGTIAAAGGVFARVTLDLRDVSNVINWQIAVGILIILLCEPLRFLKFQFDIAQGDWALAFDPAMRWMAIQTPFGHAAIARLIGAAVLVIGFVWRPLAIVGALILVGSYLAEGHTVASDDRLVLAALLFAHLAVVHWWLGALVPLRSLVVSAKASGVAHQVERFGGTAVWAVASLFIAGFVTLGVLTGWLFDPS